LPPRWVPLRARPCVGIELTDSVRENSYQPHRRSETSSLRRVNVYEYPCYHASRASVRWNSSSYAPPCASRSVIARIFVHIDSTLPSPLYKTYCLMISGERYFFLHVGRSSSVKEAYVLAVSGRFLSLDTAPRRSRQRYVGERPTLCRRVTGAARGESSALARDHGERDSVCRPVASTGWAHIPSIQRPGAVDRDMSVKDRHCVEE
jgi:hypothetical protein